MARVLAAISLGFLLGCCALLTGNAQTDSGPLLIRSPRLLALEKQLESGDKGALDSFWREESRQGTPLVETLPGDPHHVLVTFLWRGTAGTRNVVLFSPIPGAVDATGTFSHQQVLNDELILLPGTNVWFKTYRLRDDGRFTYYLSPNDSMLRWQQRKQADWDRLQADPFNPHHFVIREETHDYVRSVVELPGATPVPWLAARPDVPQGRTEVFHLESKSLGNERQIWVYTPPGYRTDAEPYRLLVLFDGWEYSQVIPTQTILENLLADGRIDPLVVVMVEQKNRILELGCSEPFNTFLVEELIPWVRQHYHVVTDPAQTIVGGLSRGGLAAACAGLRHPGVFGVVLSESGYFSWDPEEDRSTDEESLKFEWMIRQFAVERKLPLRFYLVVGLFERDHEFPDAPSLLQASRHMRDVLLAKGYAVGYEEVVSGHELYAFSAALPEALQSVAGHGKPEP